MNGVAEVPGKVVAIGLRATKLKGRVMKTKSIAGFMALSIMVFCLNIAQGAENKGGESMQKDNAQNTVGAGNAGKIVTESNMDGRKNVETLEFNEKGQLRVTSNGLDSMGVIARDKRIYFFGELKGKPKVVDLLAALKKLKDKGKTRPESDPAVEEIADIKPTGHKETIAGIEGEVHTVTWALAGKKRTEEIVLTRDPRLAAVIKGLSLDPGLMSQKPRKSELKEQVNALGAFLLKSPDSVVVSVDFSPIPDERFALKAKPGDDVDTIMEIVMSAMFGAMGAAVDAVADTTGKAMSETFAKPEPETPPEPLEPTIEEANRKLLEISQPFGLQLKAPPITDYAAKGWSAINVGAVSMFTPPGWKLDAQEKRKRYIPSAGFVAPGNDMYIELRVFSEPPRYDGLAFEEASRRYASAKERRDEGVMMGYAPVNVDGSFGHIEIMNEYGQEKNDDGSLSVRMNIFHGTKRVGGNILRAELTARFAQADQDKFGPIVLNIIRSIQFKNVKATKAIKK